MKTMIVTAKPLRMTYELVAGDSIPDLILATLAEQGWGVRDGDIIVVSSKIVSKSEGRVVNRRDVQVSRRARAIAEKNAFDPVHVELALREASEVIRSERVLISETHSGQVCNFSGVDKSNAENGTYVLLPHDPDGSAEAIRRELEMRTKCRLAVIVCDTQGRPWRRGSINVAIGCSGINPFKYNGGKRDLYGRVLKRSTVCQVDEISGLAESLMGQADERVPVVIVRGYEFTDQNGKCADIHRSKQEDLLR